MQLVSPECPQEPAGCPGCCRSSQYCTRLGMQASSSILKWCTIHLLCEVAFSPLLCTVTNLSAPPGEHAMSQTSSGCTQLALTTSCSWAGSYSRTLTCTAVGHSWWLLAGLTRVRDSSLGSSVQCTTSCLAYLVLFPQ